MNSYLWTKDTQLYASNIVALVDSHFGFEVLKFSIKLSRVCSALILTVPSFKQAAQQSVLNGFNPNWLKLLFKIVVSVH